MKKHFKLEMDDVARLIERNNSKMAEDQQVRELIENSFRAISETGEPGSFYVDYDQEIFKDTGIRKMQVIDNGIGMTADELRDGPGRISSSGGSKTKKERFGVGLKYTCYPANTRGVRIRSYKNGIGNEFVIYKKTPVDYDITITPIPYKNRDKRIKDHGTEITLMGNSKNEDTFPLLPQRRLVKYINSRYFTLPDNVTGYLKYIQKGHMEVTIQVTGQSGFLKAHTIKTGMVDMPKSKMQAAWFILPKTLQANGMPPERYMDPGHTAVLFDDEIYNVAPKYRLQRMGIWFGSENVCIYLQSTGYKLQVNDLRSFLSGPKDAELPWVEWEKEFRTNMPEELKQYVIDNTPLNDTDNSDRIRESMEPYKELFKFDQLKLSKKGDQRGGKLLHPHITNLFEHTGGKRGEETKKPKVVPGENPAKLAPNNQIIPDVKFAPASDFENPGHAASRVGPTLILLNRDFPPLVRMLDLCVSKAHSTDETAARMLLFDSISESYKRQIIETVMITETMRGYWSDEQIDRALSADGLSVAMMPCHNLYQEMKKTLKKII